MQGLEVGLLLWRAQLQMFLNQTIRSGKPGRIAGTIIAAAVIVLAWAWEAFVTWLAIQALRLFLLSLLFTAPALIVLAVATHNAVIPFGFAALYLLYPVYVVVIISLLSLLLVRFIPVGRGREVLTLFGVVLALGINLLNFLLNPALRDSGFTRH